jgi:hypothetical protein
MVRATALAAVVAGLASTAFGFQMPAPMAKPSTRVQAAEGGAAPPAEFSK